VHKFHLGLQPMYFRKYYANELKSLEESEKTNPEVFFKTATNLRYCVHE
jgi:hypothetical protein